MNTATAHPHVDPDGTVYNMGSSFAEKQGPHYTIIKFPPPAVVNGRKIVYVNSCIRQIVIDRYTAAVRQVVLMFLS